MSNIQSLKNHFINHGLTFGEYAPGLKNRMIYDCREALLTGGMLSYVGELMWDKIKKYNPEVIVGKGYGALNIMLAIQIAAEKQNYFLKTLCVRDQRKDHNRRKLIEGPSVSPGSVAVFIDDLINRGATFNSVKQSLQQEGIQLQIVAISVLIDLWNWIGSRQLEAQGMPIERIFYRHDLGDTRKDPQQQVVGALRWRSLINNQWTQGWVQSPVHVNTNNVVIAKDTHFIACHDLFTGNIKWSYQGPKPTREKGTGCKIVQHEDKLWITSYDGTVICLHAYTGDLIYKQQVDMFLHGTVEIDASRNRLYLGTEGGLQNRRGDIACLDLSTGATIWRFPTQHVVPCSPRLVMDQVVCGSNDGNLYNLEPHTGAQNWIVENIGEVKGQVGHIDDLILACTEQGKLYAINKNGAIVWQRNCGSAARHQFVQVNQDLGLIYVTNEDGMVLAFDAQGTQIWLRKLRARGFWNLSQHKDELLIVTAQGHMNLLDAATGEKKATTHLNCAVNCPAYFDDDIAVVHTESQGTFVYERNHVNN